MGDEADGLLCGIGLFQYNPIMLLISRDHSSTNVVTYLQFEKLVEIQYKAHLHYSKRCLGAEEDQLLFGNR